MTQSQNIKVPTPLHAQLKALAAARSTTMVDVLASFLTKAVEAGEIPPESSGVSASILLDLDAPNGEQGPFVIVRTPAGMMPPMSKEDALAVAAFLVSDDRSADTIRMTQKNRTGQWSVERRGTSATLLGWPPKGAERIEFTMAPVVARSLSDQMVRLAKKH